MGAGPAQLLIPGPQPTKLAVVTVSVARVGDVVAMVDSGAMVCVVRRDIVEKLLKEENLSGGFVIGFDRARVPVVGNIALTVRFGGRAVELRHVKVVETSLYSMILGAEWIEKGEVVIFGDSGRLTARVLSEEQRGSLMEGAKDREVRDYVQPNCLLTGLIAETEASSSFCVPAISLENQKPVNVCPVAAPIPSSTGLRLLLERPSQVYRPLRGLSPQLDPISEDLSTELEITSDDQHFLGVISLGLENDAPITPRYARTSKDFVLPAQSMRLLPTDVSTIEGEEWVVSKSFSSRPSREWIIPNGLLKAIGKKLYVPVVNLSNQSLKWTKGSELAMVEKLSGPVTILEEDSAVCAATEEYPPPLPDDVKQKLAVGGKLTEEQRTRLFDVIDRFSDCFVGNETASTTHGIEHSIDTGDALPIGTTLRRTSAYERRLISEQVQEMLSNGVVERSSSPWAAQVVMVPKRDGSKRFCVDFRAVNAKTKRDLYPRPRIDEILEKVAHASKSSGAKFMSSLDLKNGFWHVPIREQDREKTAFVTSDGLFQFRRMPF